MTQLNSQTKMTKSTDKTVIISRECAFLAFDHNILSLEWQNLYDINPKTDVNLWIYVISVQGECLAEASKYNTDGTKRNRIIQGQM